MLFVPSCDNLKVFDLLVLIDARLALVSEVLGLLCQLNLRSLRMLPVWLIGGFTVFTIEQY